MKKNNLYIPEDFQLDQWERELEETGTIEDEAELFQAINALKKGGQNHKLSRLFTIVSRSRATRNGYDALSIKWLEEATKLDPKNEEARKMLLKNQWIEYANLFDILNFPVIRETDNRAAKKKNAEAYIDIGQRFLSEAEEIFNHIVYKSEDQENMIASLLKEAIEETSALLKATERYDQSVTGVFHTAVHYEEMKSKLKKISELKELWSQQFENTAIEEQDREPDPLNKLNEMIGLSTVKTRITDLYRFLSYQKKRKELGLHSKEDLGLNMVLTGNPGTGKTTLARLLAQIYHQLGILPRGEVIEADRSQLVGAYVGQTEENVRKIVEKALGGVLFIDEAYSLRREGQTGNDYGQTAIDTLVSLMTGTEFGGKFAVILAGYPDEMRQFLNGNPGLRSRFPQSNFIHLPDFTNEELLLIADQAAKDNDFFMTKEAKNELGKRIEKERVDDTFGNARTVKNIVLEAIFKKGARIGSKDELSDLTILDKVDFSCAVTSSEKNPHELLNSLIGLEEVKEEVTQLISFVKMQQIRREHDLPVVPVQLHSVFTGNPGTGKTTVAKIYAEFLKECGILKRGHLIVTSRADFVAGYVGQTAIKTKKKIREALGGVLFIDEAYSLLSQSSSDFGKEVIDTLVDEMTKHNENLVVILAGYPFEMEQLLESNPGLRSRFKKFFHFPDYSVDELLKIIIKYAEHYQYHLTKDAISYLQNVLGEMNLKGNGRFASNLVDEAIQAQAYRLIGSEQKIHFGDQATYLDEADFIIAINKGIEGE